MYELPHDKTNKMACAPSEDSDQPESAQSSLSAWRKRGTLAAHWTHNEDSDQTVQMPRLIWVFTGRTDQLLVLSWGGSYGNRPAWSGQWHRKWKLVVFQIILTVQYMYIVSNHSKKVNWKVQGVPQSEAAANPWHQEEEKKEKKILVMHAK